MINYQFIFHDISNFRWLSLLKFILSIEEWLTNCLKGTTEFNCNIFTSYLLHLKYSQISCHTLLLIWFVWIYKTFMFRQGTLSVCGYSLFRLHWKPWVHVYFKCVKCIYTKRLIFLTFTCQSFVLFIFI